jgi:hypothetical protein
MSNSNNENYFNLVTSGIGYVSRVREVKPKSHQKFKAFWACTIAGLNGPEDDVVTRYYDVTVVGNDAKEVIEYFNNNCKTNESDFKKNDKILVGFNIGDAYPHQYPKDDGTTGVTMKGRLLSLKWAKVNGEFVLESKAEDKTEAEDKEETPVQGEFIPATDAA